MHISIQSHLNQLPIGRQKEIFDPALDQKYLKTFYSEDYEDASFMFELFLTHTVKTFQDFIQASCQNDLAEIKRLAHKMCPSFKVVGLTKIALTLNTICRTDIPEQKLRSLIERLDQELDLALPIIVKQVDTLDVFLRKNQLKMLQ